MAEKPDLRERLRQIIVGELRVFFADDRNPSRADLWLVEQAAEKLADRLSKTDLGGHSAGPRR